MKQRSLRGIRLWISILISLLASQCAPTPAYARGLRGGGAVLIAQPVAAATPATVWVFMGQSNAGRLGTVSSDMGSAIPGAASLNGSCTGYITTAAPTGASSSAGTITCNSVTGGTIYPGEVVGYSGSDGTRYVSASNGSSNFAGVSGTGTTGTYSISAGSGNVAVGSAASPVTLTFSFPDIGGSGTLNPRCQIWVPSLISSPSGSGSWQVANPRVNTGETSGSAQWGSEMGACWNWTTANPASNTDATKFFYIIKAAVGGSSLCPVASGSNISPEPTTTTASPTSPSDRGYQYGIEEAAVALPALVTQFGVSSYRIKSFVYTQGEQDFDTGSLCGFPNNAFLNPSKPIYSASLPNVYKANLTDLANHFAVPGTVNASFTGAIAGTTLSVSSVQSGTIKAGALLQGSSIIGNGATTIARATLQVSGAATYIGSQISGTTGGAGSYNLLVYQALAAKSTITDSTIGASTACGAVSGIYLLADSKSQIYGSYTPCATAAFNVGDTLSATGLLSGTTVTASYLQSGTVDGLYTINVSQAVSSEGMTSSLPGWGTGADSAVMVVTRTAGTFTSPAYPASGNPTSSVALGQMALSDSGGAALTVHTVSVEDRVVDPNNVIHYHGLWADIDRRVWLASQGQCDYHSPTC